MHTRVRALVAAPQVRSGQVAKLVATEGVMLQYAVDAKLDELLSAVWAELTGGWPASAEWTGRSGWLAG